VRAADEFRMPIFRPGLLTRTGHSRHIVIDTLQTGAGFWRLSSAHYLHLSISTRLLYRSATIPPLCGSVLTNCNSRTRGYEPQHTIPIQCITHPTCFARGEINRGKHMYLLYHAYHASGDVKNWGNPHIEAVKVFWS